jgi:ankyrin repeat protein
MPKTKTDPLSEQLMIAITAGDTAGDTAGVRRELSQGVPIPGDALFDAVKFGDAEMVRLLLDAGADVTIKLHREALSDAINAGRTALAKRLIDRGALRKGQDKARLLADASAEGLVEIVAILLASGADPDGRLTDLANRGTALMAAAAEGHLEVVKQLLAAGADPTLKDDKGKGVADWVKKFKPANAKDVLALIP